MGKRVLIVDDSPLIHNLLRKTLVKYGYEVCGDAKNGREGAEMFKQLIPDIVFMDINMPVMDGLESVKIIKQLSVELKVKPKIIMLSAIGDDEVTTKAKNLGVFIFLRKPFDDYKIISALHMSE
jgi:two-component system chemotaxis response regulator CheY